MLLSIGFKKELNFKFFSEPLFLKTCKYYNDVIFFSYSGIFVSLKKKQEKPKSNKKDFFQLYKTQIFRPF